jgi:alkaline phosphatase
VEAHSLPLLENTNNLPLLLLQDHSVVPFDSSNRDNGAGPRTYDNVKGLAMPDVITAFEEGGNQYLITANEGDGREYTCFPEIDDGRAKDLTVDSSAFPNWVTQGENDELGRSKINPNIGDDDGDGDYDRIFTLGSRSFSIFENNIILNL